MRFTDLADRIATSPPLLGGTRLVCVDGPAGSGKTTFADRLAAEVAAPVVHLDDLYAGWTLDGVTDRLVTQVLDPVAGGRDAVFLGHDWATGEFTVPLTVPARPHLVVEGCGAAARAIDHLVTLRVWVQAPPAVCARRWAERGGPQMVAFQADWARAEAVVFTREGTRPRADLRVDGDPGTDPGPEAFVLL